MAAKARTILPASPIADRLALEQMRGKLLKDIERFHRDSRSYMSGDALRAFLDVHRDGSTLGAEWDEDQLSSLGADGPDREDIPGVVERTQLFLPSTLGAGACRTHGMSKLLQAERRLRVGQMNDALHAVRVGIGYKSYLYRTSVRVANSQTKKLRSFDDVHCADAGILSNARVYETARSSLLRLYDPANPEDEEELESTTARFRPLNRSKDLKVNTAIIESTTRGLSHLHLPWFWYLDTGATTADGSWTDESKSCLVMVDLFC